MASYQETLNFMYAQLPMFTRVGAAAYKPNLDNTIRLLQAIGNPQDNIRCIHIAGTNGKGSTSNMLAAVLQSAGYHTGLYTSPHLVDFRERIRINGLMIPKRDVTLFVAKHKSLIKAIQPSFFEMTVALCFDYFARQKVDIAVIETGLGGRLDSTNVIHPILSVITNIGLDHTQLLGHTLEAIALEKAGIIKTQVPVVIGETHPQTKGVFLTKAQEMNSPITFADRHIHLQTIKQTHEKIQVQVSHGKEPWLNHLTVSLAGTYQLKNIATTLEAIHQLGAKLQIPTKAIRDGLSHVQQLTGFAGRWQILQKKPLAIADTGHNAHGLRQSMKQLKSLQASQLHIVFGVVQDKSLDDIMPLLPQKATYYLCAPNLPRALPAHVLQEVFQTHRLQSEVYKNVTTAYLKALASCKTNDVVFVGGSTFVVAELLSTL